MSSTPDRPGDTDGTQDPVLVRRRQAARLAATGKRLGYLLYGLAILLFALAMVTGLPRGLAIATVASLVVGSLFLAPSIVVSYGVKAADREDRERGDPRRAG
jgi:hypothetical protein